MLNYIVAVKNMLELKDEVISEPMQQSEEIKEGGTPTLPQKPSSALKKSLTRSRSHLASSNENNLDVDERQSEEENALIVPD